MSQSWSVHRHLPVTRSRIVDGVLQIGVGLAVFAIYLLVTHGLHPDRAVAAEHGRQLLAAERSVHWTPEFALDHWLAGHRVLGDLASWEYAVVYVVSTFGVLGWLWLRRRDDFGWGRDALIVVTVLGIACFALWPAAPPRLLAGSGITDVVRGTHNPLSWGSATISAGADQLAAMPSLHVAWAAWVSLALWRTRDRWRQQLLAGAQVVVTVLVVLATGNHWWLDAVGGLVAVGFGAAAAEGVHRLRDRVGAR